MGKICVCKHKLELKRQSMEWNKILTLHGNVVGAVFIKEGHAYSLRWHERSPHDWFSWERNQV